MRDVYAEAHRHRTPPCSAAATRSQEREKRFIEAITEGMRESMRRFPNLVLMGQDIAEYGGAFKVTDGFVAEFGKDRVRNTPLCESAILGAGLGLSINGMKAMVEMQFADFVSEGMTQITNNYAKAHWRWGQNADVVVRMPTGAGSGAGPFHSQSNEAWFTKTPGLKVVYPAFPADAKGLLCSAFEDPDPVMYFEHKNLYRSLTGPVPDGWYTVPIGEAALVARRHRPYDHHLRHGRALGPGRARMRRRSAPTSSTCAPCNHGTASVCWKACGRRARRLCCMRTR